MNKKEILKEITDIIESNINVIATDEWTFDKSEEIHYISEDMTDEDQVKTLKWFNLFIEYKELCFCVEYVTHCWSDAEVDSIKIVKHPHKEITKTLNKIFKKYIPKNVYEEVKDKLTQEMITLIIKK